MGPEVQLIDMSITKPPGGVRHGAGSHWLQPHAHMSASAFWVAVLIPLKMRQGFP
jgi:hypothetical protein